MRVISIIFLAVVVLLSLAAGGAKVAQMPQEIAFFEGVDLNQAWMIALGCVQILGAILAIIPKTKATGLIAMAAAFLASAVMVFAAGSTSFALVSLIPAVLCVALFLRVIGAG